MEYKIEIYLRNKKKMILFADNEHTFNELFNLLDEAQSNNKKLIKLYNLILPVDDFYMAQYEAINKNNKKK